jgi:predicted CoA-substrate-specific enzyme activase
MAYNVGVDIGSVSINCVVIDEHGQIIVETPYLRHFGLVYKETYKLLKEVLSPSYYAEPREIRSVSFTGVGGQLIAEILSAPYEVETICQALGATHIMPGVRSIMSVGGQDACLFQLGHENSQWHLDAFNMNGPCASGTGSFIDQQAERLALSIYGPDFDMNQEKLQQTLDDFIALGLQSTYPASVACRCTVFTKSDMIHLQNKGESLSNIIAGLHYGNAANYVSSIVGNRELASPLIFIGGMASNRLQLQAFRKYFPDLQVPKFHTSMGAIGVALQAQKMGWNTVPDLSRIESHELHARREFPKGEKLQLGQTVFDPDNALEPWKSRKKKLTPAFLGVDIGSTSTKYALIDQAGKIIHKSYIPTQGKPIEVTQRLLQTLSTQMGKHIQILGISTTGSGRNVVGNFLSADLIIDEITTHARGAIEVDPNVDTIFEIGGQDSKYIHIDNTHPIDFDMNKVCAAGTGSFLHELANKMKINIVGEFQDIALAAENPIALAERCTVFMESDLVGYAQRGARREDLIAGLCYAIVHNYLNRVVGKRHIGQRIMFLGGPSLNKGIVAAFEKVLKRPIIVPKHREVMGAFGAALSIKELYEKGEISVQTRDLEALAHSNVEFSETVCRADKKCHNECKLKVYTFGGKKSIWGGDCGRYEGDATGGRAQTNYFLERHRIFNEALEGDGISMIELDSNSGKAGGPTIGIPLALHTLQWGVLWAQVLSELGFTVLITPRTNNSIALAGVESITAETCFPVQVFHGHVRYLLDRTDYLFLPNVINMPTPEEPETGAFCPLVSSSQYMVRAALDIADDRIIRPTLHMKEGSKSIIADFHAGFPSHIRPDKAAVERAVLRAWEKQEAFRQRLLKRGREVLAHVSPDEPVWVITGRPYNLFDERLNLQLGRQLAKLGIKAIPMDFLDTDGEDLSEYPRMYWGMGAKILRTAKLIARTPNFYGVHLTNFSCGADSFIEHFYRHILQQKPSLILELDEHSAVAGMLTRIEAYRNVVKNLQQGMQANGTEDQECMAC